MLVVAVAFAASCSSGSNDASDGAGSDADPVFDASVVVVAQAEVARDPIVGPSPDSDQTAYFCGDQLLATLEELVAFDTLPSPPQERVDAESTKPLGPAADWVQFGSGYIADRRLLDTSPPTLVIAAPGSNWTAACVPTRATDRQPVAWRLADRTGDQRVTIEVEPCWNDADLVTDVRFDGNRALVAVYADGLPSGSCVVDGSATIDLNLPDGVSEVLSSQYWPFAPGDPSEFWTLEPPTAAVVEPTDEAWNAIRCDVRADLGNVQFRLFDVPAGGVVSVEINEQPWRTDVRVQPRDEVRRIAHPALTDRQVSYGDLLMATNVGFAEPQQATRFYEDAQAGQVLSFTMTVSIDQQEQTYSCGHTAILDRPVVEECRVSVAGGLPQFVTSPWLSPPQLTLLRDGEPLPVTSISGPTIDMSPLPGLDHQYRIQLADRGATETVECGTVPIEWITPDAEEIAAARAIFQRLAIGPYVYADVEGPDDVERLIMAFGTDGFVFFEPVTGGQPYDPTTIHDRLIAALEAGSEVRYLLDVSSGFPVRWSIDGQDYGVSCLRFETSPPEIFGESCGDHSTDLLGQPR